MNVALIAISLFAAASAGERSSAREADLTIRFDNHGAQVEVVGLPPQALATIRDAKLTPVQWQRLLSVAVAGKGSTPAAPMLGKYAATGGVIAFTPRFPLRPGLGYRVLFNPAALPGKPLPGARRLETTLALPKPPVGPAATVAAVYPSGDTLPANLLKFYIHFSAPMTRGDSYRFIHIVDADGRDVPDAFLELGEELWNSDGTRLTLLFDPGRIKRGLKPNQEVGAPLVEGHRYALVINAGWPDARRTPLAQEFRKPFRVTSPDYVQPNTRRWQITPPHNSQLEPLTIKFDEPLDHALVQHTLAVRNPAGRPVTGRVTMSDQETQWQLHPDAPWQPGAYEVVVDTATEDRAGNSIGRLFETRGPTSDASAPVVLHFDVQP